MMADPATRYGDTAEFLNSEAPFTISSSSHYFPGESERCVEIPCVFSSIGNEQKILDIGTSLADSAYFAGLINLVALGRQVSSLDIVPRAKVMNRFEGFDINLINQISEHLGDIRTNPLSNATFDLVLCVSVLEHVGFDAYIDADDTVFDRPFEEQTSLPTLEDWPHDSVALNAMLKLVKPGGRLILTVPYGRGGVFTSVDSKGRYAAHLEFNLSKWIALTESLTTPCDITTRTFRMNPEGWTEVDLAAEFPDGGSGSDHEDMGVLVAEFHIHAS